MQWIDLHNVAMLLILAPLLAATGSVPEGPVDFVGGPINYGMIAGAITFICLGGRILAHGTDRHKSGKDWRAYVVYNLTFNLIAATIVGAVCSSVSR